MHTPTHPGAKLGRREDVAAEASETEPAPVNTASIRAVEPALVNAVSNENDFGDPAVSIIERPSVVQANVTAEELMARLADEDGESGDNGVVDVAVRLHGA